MRSIQQIFAHADSSALQCAFGHTGENFESAALGVESVRTEGWGREAMRRMRINKITITACAIVEESDIIRSMNENQIVVYQPNETVRLEVELHDESIWLPQQKIAALFGVQKAAISKHLKNIFETGELQERSVVSKMETTAADGKRYNMSFYNLDAIIAVGYRVNSARATQFRIWATQVLKAYLLKGYAINERMNQFEDRVDRRLSKTERDVIALKEQVDFFVQTKTPPVQGVFFDGQLWDACSLAEKLVARAKKSIVLIDNWVGPGTFDILAKKRKGVAVRVVTSARGNRLAASDIAKFNEQYPSLTVTTSAAFHDRFLILDASEIYLIGASLKDLGKKCFAFSKLDAANIDGILAKIS
jgi:hypothetical protein